MTDIISPSLTQLVKERVQDVYKAKSDKEFNDAFEWFVGPQASIRVNGNSIPREKYKEMLRGQTNGEVRADITVKDVVAVPATTKKESMETGTVGMAFKARVYNKFFVFGGRETNEIHSSLNVEVTNPQPPEGPYGDFRRVHMLNEVITDHESTTF